MRTEHPKYQLRTALRLAALLLIAIAAAAAATASAASPAAPAFTLRTTCTSSSPAFVSMTAPRLLLTTLGHAKRTWSYGWPVKPFDRQHPVRGFLNDPRTPSFHFGIDIAVPDGTPVYAVEAGTINIRTDEEQVIEVRTHGASLFAYWHVAPMVRQGQHVGLHQLIARVAKGWGHVHLGERDGVYYVNPLRDGGLGPYTDRTPPTVDWIGLDGQALVTAAHDTPDPRVPGAWADEPVTPGLLRWRTVDSSGRETPLRTAFDFRSDQLFPSRFGQVYTPRTRGNHKGQPGQYCFYLEHNARPKDGTIVEVEVSDTAGNTAVYAVILTRAVTGL
jgi:hypothetical protein